MAKEIDISGFDEEVKNYDLSGFDQGVTNSTPSTLESILRGAAQGASLGFADEATAAVLSSLTDDDYNTALAESRHEYKQAEEANPMSYFGGNIAGGIAVPVPGLGLAKGALTAGKLAKAGAIAGAASGIGASESDKLSLDTAKEAAGGAMLGAGASVALGKALPWIGKEIGGVVEAQPYFQDLVRTFKSGLAGENLLGKDLTAKVVEKQRLLMEDFYNKMGQVKGEAGKDIGEFLSKQEGKIDVDSVINKLITERGLEPDSAEGKKLFKIFDKIRKAKKETVTKTELVPKQSKEMTLRKAEEARSVGEVKASYTTARRQIAQELRKRFVEEGDSEINVLRTMSGNDPKKLKELDALAKKRVEARLKDAMDNNPDTAALIEERAKQLVDEGITASREFTTDSSPSKKLGVLSTTRADDTLVMPAEPLKEKTTKEVITKITKPEATRSELQTARKELQTLIDSAQPGSEIHTEALAAKRAIDDAQYSGLSPEAKLELDVLKSRYRDISRAPAKLGLYDPAMSKFSDAELIRTNALKKLDSFGKKAFDPTQEDTQRLGEAFDLLKQSTQKGEGPNAFEALQNRMKDASEHTRIARMMADENALTGDASTLFATAKAQGAIGAHKIGQYANKTMNTVTSFIRTATPDSLMKMADNMATMPQYKSVATKLKMIAGFNGQKRQAALFAMMQQPGDRRALQDAAEMLPGINDEGMVIDLNEQEK